MYIYIYYAWFFVYVSIFVGLNHSGFPMAFPTLFFGHLLVKVAGTTGGSTSCAVFLWPLPRCTGDDLPGLVQKF